MFSVVRHYLEQEWARKAVDAAQEKSAAPVMDKGMQAIGKEQTGITFTPESMPGVCLSEELPQQTSSSSNSCGLFLLAFADFFIGADPKSIMIDGSENTAKSECIGSCLLR